MFLVALIGLPWGLAMLTRSILCASVTPSNHRKLGEYQDSKGNIELVRDGYSVERNWGSNALANIPKS